MKQLLSQLILLLIPNKAWALSGRRNAILSTFSTAAKQLRDLRVQQTEYLDDLNKRAAKIDEERGTVVSEMLKTDQNIQKIESFL